MGNWIETQYLHLLEDILEQGVKKTDRTGTGTISVFGRQIRHNMRDGFPLLTTKKLHFKSIVTELLWFLRGDTNIKYLVDNDCNIWNGDAWTKYINEFRISCPKCPEITKEDFINKIKTDDEFANKWGELGPIYGAGWRNFEGVDQISELIYGLKTNPDSRRLRVSAWQPHKLKDTVLPPCHTDFQVYTRELSVKERLFFVNKSNEEYEKISLNEEQYKSIGLDFDLYLTTKMNGLNIPTRAISLMFNMRSTDVFLGLPFNIASYGLLLEIIAKEVNMIPDELIYNGGDVHLYSNHVEQAKEQIGRDLTDEERYNIWFTNNYETGMERFFEPNKLPNFDDPYYNSTPKRTREPYSLPTLHLPHYTQCEYGSMKFEIWDYEISDIVNELNNYQSHPKITAPLSN
jgi:thymidylate synthase